MKNTWIIFLLAAVLLLASTAYARVITGLIDRNGNPVHSGDEFTLHVSATVTTDPYGYRYTYDLTNDVLSNQPVWRFGFFFQDVYSVVIGTASTPWEQPTYPKATGNNYAFSSFFSCDPDMLNPPPLSPGQILTGYTFVSPYPPGIIKAYAEGDTNYPWYDSAPSNLDAYDLISPYGPGKVFATVGPVKPATLNVTNNYSVISCTGGICDVQLDITGPQDPTGTAYTYTWSGTFGTAMGAKPIVQLAAGAYTVSVAVSDPYATLVTATMPITVIDPNPPVVTPPAGGGNTGGGANQGGAGQGTGSNAGNGNTGGNNQGANGNVGTGSNDMDHDGITDNQDNDRDGDGKPNREDLDPDHPD